MFSFLTEIHSVSIPSFADDTQLLDSCPDQKHATVLTMQTWISDIKDLDVTKQTETELRQDRGFPYEVR